jgi:hypothetical protein
LFDNEGQHLQADIIVVVIIIIAVLDIKHSALHMLTNCSTTDSYPHPVERFTIHQFDSSKIMTGSGHG